MEKETSALAKLGIVLIALAVLIALGFGIFQISRNTANDGSSDLEHNLEIVEDSTFSEYDQSIITGSMARNAITSFENKPVTVLVATQSWVDLIEANSIEVGDYDELLEHGSGLNLLYASSSDTDGNELPVVWAYSDKDLSNEYLMTASDNSAIHGAFINYNAIVGGVDTADGSNPSGTTNQTAKIQNTEIHTTGIYFDSNCFRVNCGLATSDNGAFLSNGVMANLYKTGKTEYIPEDAKFRANLLKDTSGTTLGVVLEQINNA